MLAQDPPKTASTIACTLPYPDRWHAAASFVASPPPGRYRIPRESWDVILLPRHDQPLFSSNATASGKLCTQIARFPLRLLQCWGSCYGGGLSLRPAFIRLHPSSLGVKVGLHFCLRADLLQLLSRSTGACVLSDERRLVLHALQQQATLGPCTSSKPWGWNVVESAKHDAWSHLGNMSSVEAMRLYVKALEEDQARPNRTSCWSF